MTETRYRSALARVENHLRDRFAVVAERFGQAEVPQLVTLAPARDASHGDYATPAALAAAKTWRRNPLEIARDVASDGAAVADICVLEAAPPGFVNVRMRPQFWADVVRDALEQGDRFGSGNELASLGPVLVEFGSANPTGPLAVVQGRACSFGASLVELLKFAGADATSETYVNDAGAQLESLADSLYARYATLCGRPTALPEDGYPGDYLIDIAEALRARDGDRWLDAPLPERRAPLAKFARDLIVAQQERDMADFGVRYDRWFSEAAMHDAGEIDDVVEQLRAGGYAYERDGAVWLASTRFGDDKDRVLRRSDGRPTYLAADAAYHRDKLRRGNKLLVNVLGPDHHGYVARLSAIVAALGSPGALEVIIAQHVTLKRGGETVAMSKRAGNIITLRELLDEVGRDAARFFFIERTPESHLVFDLELAIERSSKNPVFYVQYGHARIASILRNAQMQGRAATLERARRGDDVAALGHPAEFALARRLADFGRTAIDAARARAPHRIAEFARDLATDFHAFYRDCLVLSDDERLSSARLSLCMAARSVLARALGLVGVSAPESMVRAEGDEPA